MQKLNIFFYSFSGPLSKIFVIILLESKLKNKCIPSSWHSHRCNFR